MVDLTETFCHMKPKKVLVIGDVIFDIYTKGLVHRICPEAPVPVLRVTKEVSMPGGAANVALNLKSLGAEVTLVGKVGNDLSGDKLISELEQYKIIADGVFCQPGSYTPTKNRFIANGQQLIRTDYEIITPLDGVTETKVIHFLKTVLKEHDVIAISDYAKGFLTDSLLECVMKEAAKYNIAVIVDPKGSDYAKYQGAFMVKPNRKEAYEAANLPETADLKEVAQKIFSNIQMKNLLITLSEDGMALFDQSGHLETFEVQVRDVLDVTGAGDTSLAMICLAVANKISLPKAIKFANIASSIAIQKLGCVSVGLAEVLNELTRIEPSSKIFDQKANPFIFEKVIQGRDVVLINLKNQTEMTTALFHFIYQTYEKQKGKKILVYSYQKPGEDDFVKLLASMSEIDFVLLDKKWYNRVEETSGSFELVSYEIESSSVAIV